MRRASCFQGPDLVKLRVVPTYTLDLGVAAANSLPRFVPWQKARRDTLRAGEPPAAHRAPCRADLWGSGSGISRSYGPRDPRVAEVGLRPQGTTALTLHPRFGTLIAPQSRMADCPEKSGTQAHGKHHDSESGRRCKDSPPGSGGGPWTIHGRGGTADPAECGWPKTEFPEPREHHPFTLRAEQRCGSGVACARAWT